MVYFLIILVLLILSFAISYITDPDRTITQDNKFEEVLDIWIKFFGEAIGEFAEIKEFGFIVRIIII